VQPTAVTEPNNELGERLMSANRCITIRDVATAVNADANSAWSAPAQILAKYDDAECSGNFHFVKRKYA